MARYLRDVFPDGCLQGFSDAWRAYLAKTGSFRIHDARILPRTGAFPVRGPPGTHEAKKLPWLTARERTTATYCHCRQPGNAPERHLAAVGRGERIPRAFCYGSPPGNARRRNIVTICRSGIHSVDMLPRPGAAGEGRSGAQRYLRGGMSGLNKAIEQAGRSATYSGGRTVGSRRGSNLQRYLRGGAGLNP